MFFEQFFNSRGGLTPNSQGEAAVRCPFPHDKGYEGNPSAHVNVKKAIFHCKTCQAEGRFDNGGLSEAGFIAEYYNTSYEQALQYMSSLGVMDKDEIQWSSWDRCEEILHINTVYMDYLQNVRGLTQETIITYRLGSAGDGIQYPVTIYDQLCDIRTYDPDSKPKMRSLKGAKPLLFPFDHWVNDPRPTLFCAGENDTLLARQSGFNAITLTGGEGSSVPNVFRSLFKTRAVYICYDCDEAGVKGGLKTAFELKEAGATVYIVNLGLAGTKEDKDVTDFFLKHKRTANDLQMLIDAAVPYTEEMYIEAKNQVYPLVDLWDVPEGRFSGRHISSRVVMSGKYDMPMRCPTAVKYECKGPRDGNEVCERCPIRGQSGYWTISKDLSEVLELVEVTRGKQLKKIYDLCRMPHECPNGDIAYKAYQVVYKVVFTPDVETEDILSGFRSVEQHAYTVGLNLEDGQRYRAYFRAHAHPTDGQRVYMVVDRAETSDNALNMFKMTDEIKQQLTVFQGDPAVIMEDRAKRMHDITKIFRPNPKIARAVDLMYHAPLRFRFRDREMKGYPEVLVVGESRTGKTETALMFQRYVGLGNFMPVKGATVAGVLGGADKLPNGGHKITWGTIPRNHKGLVIMDELSGMGRDVIAALTSVRSERVATVHKIAKGKAPAETRLYWTSNPRTQENGQSRNVKDYPTGVQILLDLIGADEDVARFDLALLIVKDQDSSPLDTPEVLAHAPEVYRNLILWAWSRTSDQIKFEEGVEEYIVQIAAELNEKYDTDVKIFGAEAWKKLARIAVACASSCFSTDPTGDILLVGKVHVDWAAGFLRDCYDNNVFRLSEYVRERRAYNETNEAANLVVAGICRRYPMVVRALLNAMESISMFNLQSISGIQDRGDFAKLMGQLSSNFLVNVNSQGVQATRRFRLAVDVYKGEYYKSKMIPLAEKDGVV